MKKKFFSDNFIISLGIIFFLVFAHHTSISQPLERVFDFIFSPFQSALYTSASTSDKETSSIFKTRQLSQENQQLKQKVIELEKKIVNLEFYIEENNLLLEQQKWLESKKFKHLPVKITVRAINNNPNLIQIDKGSSSGLEKGMAIIAEKGVMIGRIIELNPQNSIVRLLIDENSSISATIANNSQIIGLVEGVKNLSLNLNYILKNQNINPGDKIMTSGFNNNIPAGILIGEIDQVIEEENNIFKQASIITPANFNYLRILSVIIP